MKVTAKDFPLIEDWIRGLRSGEFTRIRGDYHDGHCGFCAVGVALEMVRQKEPHRWQWQKASMSCDIDYEFVAVIETTNAHWPLIQFFQGVFDTDIIHLNDDENWSFAQLANWLEARLSEASASEYKSIQSPES